MENFEDEMLKILTAAAFVALIVGVINEGWKEVLTNIIMVGLVGWISHLHCRHIDCLSDCRQ